MPYRCTAISYSSPLEEYDRCLTRTPDSLNTPSSTRTRSTIIVEVWYSMPKRRTSSHCHKYYVVLLVNSCNSIRSGANYHLPAISSFQFRPRRRCQYCIGGITTVARSLPAERKSTSNGKHVLQASDRI